MNRQSVIETAQELVVEFGPKSAQDEADRRLDAAAEQGIQFDIARNEKALREAMDDEEFWTAVSEWINDYLRGMNEIPMSRVWQIERKLEARTCDFCGSAPNDVNTPFDYSVHDRAMVCQFC